MRNNFLIALFILAGFIALGLFAAGCASSEEESTLPWATPTGWENNKMPGLAPTYGDRNY